MQLLGQHLVRLVSAVVVGCFQPWATCVPAVINILCMFHTWIYYHCPFCRPLRGAPFPWHPKMASLYPDQYLEGIWLLHRHTQPVAAESCRRCTHAGCDWLLPVAWCQCATVSLRQMTCSVRCLLSPAWAIAHQLQCSALCLEV